MDAGVAPVAPDPRRWPMKPDATEAVSAGTPEGAAPVVGVDDPAVVRALQEYRLARTEGKNPSREELLHRFPQVAAEMAACLDALEFLHGAAAQLPPGPADPFGLALFSGESVQAPLPLGDFRILREVGRGGMGVVYEAAQL